MTDITAFGAAGDGAALDSPAIQAAIDECHRSGGGTVLVPAGDYRIGSVELKSGVTLYLESGATLRASTDRSHYREDWSAAYDSRVLIKAVDAESVGIAGHGVIQGFGTDTFGSWWGVPEPPKLRVCTCFFENCRSVAIEDVRIRHSSFWTIHLKHCDTVRVARVDIRNHRYHLNTDGIVPDGCRHVFVTDCRLSTGDDCIPIKSTEGRDCEHIVVSNCLLETPNTAIKLGTESYGNFRGIHASGCSIVNSSIGIGIFVKDGGTVESVSMSGMTIESADLHAVKPVLPLIVDIEKRHADSALGAVRDIVFRDLFIRTQSSILLQGAPESRLENVALLNVTMRIAGFVPFEGRSKPITGKRTLKHQRDTEFIGKPSYVTAAYCKDLRLGDIAVYEGPEAVRSGRRDICVSYSSNVTYNHAQIEGEGDERWIGQRTSC